MIWIYSIYGMGFLFWLFLIGYLWDGSEGMSHARWWFLSFVLAVFWPVTIPVFAGIAVGKAL